MTTLRTLPLLRRTMLAAGLALWTGAATAATRYDTWAGLYGLTGTAADPTANPDGDRYPNMLEYAFGSDPLVAETDYRVAPALEAHRGGLRFVFRLHNQSAGIAKFRVLRSLDTKNWIAAPGEAEPIATDGAMITYALPVPSGGTDAFYRLEVTVPYGSAAVSKLQGLPMHESGLEATITIGTNVGSGTGNWGGPPDGLPYISSAVIHTTPPLVGGDGPDKDKPDLSKYPQVAGASLVSFTEGAFADYAAANRRPPRRSWMGFFLWGNGTPPPGLSPGYPVTGSYDTTKPWDYFGFIYPEGTNPDSTTNWSPIRMDQQPLYLGSQMLHYAWPPGQFGYVTKPLQFFADNVRYWHDKQIVRGVNISRMNPFFYQYGDYYTGGDLPDAWREQWFYSASRPVETMVIVPGNLKPDELLENGAWNDIGDPNPQNLPRHQPFPYPVWDTSLAAKDQTPFNIQVDRAGDFDADLVWEGTHPGAVDYAKNRYVRTPFDQPGKGNYLKMTVAQGSPFTWCETNNSRYVTFYNLIRENLPTSIDNNAGTGARTIAGGPWPVQGVSGVSYVLLYGDVNNPNQFHQEVQPWYFDEATGQPGGFNSPGQQHNHTYTAVYFRTDSVRPVALGSGRKGSTASNGTDAQGNPYFYLEFQNPGKNWFVTGSVPVMRYYAAGVTPDPEPVRIQAAKDWAQQMGKYAFNFPIKSQVSYSVKNMYQADSTFALTFANPYAASRASGAGAMTVNPNQTVLGLMPHHYQPVTLGPDLTKTARPQVRWSPLRHYDRDFPIPASAPPNANKNTASTPSRWGYWSMLGNLKPVITGRFTASYPFQNFLPMMPAPDWTESFDVNGALLVNVTDAGTGNVDVTTPPAVTIQQQSLAGSGATFHVNIIDDKVSTVDVLTGGSGYANGSPSAATYALFDNPPGGGTRATANVMVENGEVKAVLVSNPGSNYTSAPGLTLTSPPIGTGADFDVVVDRSSGSVQQILIKNGGSGYPIGLPAPMTVHIAPPTSPSPANGGRQATAYAQVGGEGNILAVFMLDGGFGYSPTITVEQAGITEAPVILPRFDPATHQLLTGPATVISPGSGLKYDQPYTVKVNGTGTGATAEIVAPGIVYKIEDPGLPGFAAGGSYPSSGNAADDAARVRIHIAPPPAGGAAQAAKLLPEGVVRDEGSAYWVLGNPGKGYSSSPAPTVGFTDDNGTAYTYTVVNVDPGTGAIVNLNELNPPTAPHLTSPKTLSIPAPPAGEGHVQAVGTVYPTFHVDLSKVVVDGSQPVVTGYAGDADVSFSGGEIETADNELPKIDFSFTTDGKLDAASLGVDPSRPGKGWHAGGSFTVRGGRGFDARLRPILSGGTPNRILGVKVLKGGSGYPSQVFATANPSSGSQLEVVVKDGAIAGVKVVNGGSFGEGVIPPIVLTSQAGSIDPIAHDPKGPPASVTYSANPDGTISNTFIVNNAGENYIPGSQAAASATTPQAYIQFEGRPPVAGPSSQAHGLVARVIPRESQVQQVLYDSLISYYTTSYASKNLAPFGGGFEGASAPDGYGLGNQLEAAMKFTGDLFNFQQHIAAQPGSPDQPAFAPSSFALNAASSPTSSYAGSALQTNSPAFTLSGALKLSVQSLQRTVTRLFDSNIASNTPGDGSQTWKMDYFNLYDEKVGRVVINPTATVPAKGITSSVMNPPAPDGNAGKTGLNAWRPGLLWSGFGVSDQWNDQHYFYGYYLSTAALAGIFDRSWEPAINGKPAALWTDPGQMGTAIDQWLMTMAYDPDNAALDSALYKIPDLTYQKFAFFDQWNGHSWATGVAPAPSYGVIQPSGWGNWIVRGTTNAQYNQENENSIYEGLQAWSAAVLWGGATDRKAVVDLGIYLMATEMATADLYFLDKNFNLGVENNPWSWAPVTTVNSSTVPKNGGNNNRPAGTDYVTSAPEAFWKPYPSFGGPTSSGNSLIRKPENSINNFFLGYPAGSKLIQAFPPTPWTLAISRNNDYMRSWAGAFMREEWKEIRDMNTRFYSAPDWLSMAMTSALCGVPFNPGDLPYPKTGTSTTPSIPPYIDRLWSEWVTPSAPAGINAPIKGFVNQTSVLSFLLALDKYGTPDWTYIAKAVDSDGAVEDDNAIVFTAVFSKVSGANVDTSFIAFNPGWTTRHVKFFRLAPDGSIGPEITVIGNVPGKPGLVAVDPKRMVTITNPIPIE